MKCEQTDCKNDAQTIITLTDMKYKPAVLSMCMGHVSGVILLLREHKISYKVKPSDNFSSVMKARGWM